MPQSRLPDINNAFVSYRNEFKTSMTKKEFKSATGSLFTMNSLLPLEYRVRISSDEYIRLSKTHRYKQCLVCKKEIDEEDSPVEEIQNNVIDEFLFDQKSQRLWHCPECKAWNKIELTPRINQVLDSTMVFGVVPNQPRRQNGIASVTPAHNDSGMVMSNAKRFEQEMEVWLWLFNQEIEERIAQYRDDNWQKEQSMTEEVDTSMEE